MVDGGMLNKVKLEIILEKEDIVIGIDVVGGKVGKEDNMKKKFEEVIGKRKIKM